MASSRLLGSRSTLCSPCLVYALLDSSVQFSRNAALHTSAVTLKGGPRTYPKGVQPKFRQSIAKARLVRQGVDKGLARLIVSGAHVRAPDPQETSSREYAERQRGLLFSEGLDTSDDVARLRDIDHRIEKLRVDYLSRQYIPRGGKENHKLQLADKRRLRVIRKLEKERRNEVLAKALAPHGLTPRLGHTYRAGDDEESDRTRRTYETPMPLRPPAPSVRELMKVAPLTAISGRMSDKIDALRYMEKREDRYSDRRDQQTLRDTIFQKGAPPIVQQEFMLTWSPPLFSGILDGVKERLGLNPKTTPIQKLSFDHFFGRHRHHHRRPGQSEVLLAAETGSGKTYAYLIPMIQALKETEKPEMVKVNLPRALILAPTHELCRQLAGALKGITHMAKLRVECRSNPLHQRPTPQWDETAHRQDSILRPIDVMVGTPSSLLNEFRLTESVEQQLDENNEVVVKADHGLSQGLENVEWVIVDEADVLLNADFRLATRALLHFVREAVSSKLSPSDPLVPPSSSRRLPFNLLFSTATVSTYLEDYLKRYHPHIVQLRSPMLHHLPETLKLERVLCSRIKKHKNAEIGRYILKIWDQERRDATAWGRTYTEEDKSRVLVFCNDPESAIELGDHLMKELKIPNTVMLSTTEERVRHKGSNHHLDGFLLGSPGEYPEADTPSDTILGKKPKKPKVPTVPRPRVLITTSLLSRGLDFSPTVKHVLIADEPRNMVDFMHRAGRSGRAGVMGKVVVFSPEKVAGKENWMQELRSRMRLSQVVTA